jgi:hypothetical protein
MHMMHALGAEPRTRQLNRAVNARREDEAAEERKGREREREREREAPNLGDLWVTNWPASGQLPPPPSTGTSHTME